jgi:four helix bundle protein
MHNFRQLRIWQRSIAIVKEIYHSTIAFPIEEKFGIKSQICRAAISIPTNVAEGCGRSTNKDLSRFLDIAVGSAYELETLLIIANDLEYIASDKINLLISEINEIERMIYQFKSSLS